MDCLCDDCMKRMGQLQLAAREAPKDTQAGNAIVSTSSPVSVVSMAAGSGKKKRQKSKKKKVFFTAEEPEVHHYDPHNGYGAPVDTINNGSSNVGPRKSELTEQLTLLSTLHGRARRQLRDLTKHDLKTVVKYGKRTEGKVVNGKQRWIFEYNNTVVITDNSCKKEITSYNKAINIERATITEQMIDNHNKVVRILTEEPHLCTTHSIIIVDQSGSMKTCDVSSFRSRSDASYGTLALDYIAEQLYQMGDEFSVDAVTIIEMKQYGSVIVDREPLDWILFNKVLDRISAACPQSHGNYVNSLSLAENIIKRERSLFADLDADDIPAFMLLFVSDGKPSDDHPRYSAMRHGIVARLAQKLRSKLTFIGMGIGATGSDFEQLQMLVDVAKAHGAEGQFNHAGLNTATLSNNFSSIATSMTTIRNDLRSTTGQQVTKTEKSYSMRQKESEDISDLIPFRRETNDVCRYKYSLDSEAKEFSWKSVSFVDNRCAGFDIDKDPFGKGAERLAYTFQEIAPKKNGQRWDKVGDLMVAKESRFIEDKASKEAFHIHFCHAQRAAQSCALHFNEAVMIEPLLKPSVDEVSLPPPISFLDCSVYEYTNEYGERCGVLVEKFLRGKFTKFNSNNGFVHNDDPNGASIHLEIGEVLLTDFAQAFSHWVYEKSSHNMVVCDLQGILDMEGFRPAFRLTDPAICSKSRGRNSQFGKTDLGLRGIRNFCSRHICNGVCIALKLPPPNGRYSIKKDNAHEDGWNETTNNSYSYCQPPARAAGNDADADREFSNTKEAEDGWTLVTRKTERYVAKGAQN